MRLSRASLISLATGGAAAALTVVCFLALEANPYRDPLPGVSRVLALGVFAAAIPFGGVHELSISDGWLLAAGSLLNGLLWASLARATVSFVRGIRRARAFDSNKHVT